MVALSVISSQLRAELDGYFPDYRATVRRRSVGARLLGLGFESRSGNGCSSLVFVMCCAGSGLCDELITLPEWSYRCVYLIVCDLETSTTTRPRHDLGCSDTEKEDGSLQ